MLTKKTPNTSGMIKKTDHNTNITEIESKIRSVTGLVATAAFNTKATEIENNTWYYKSDCKCCSEYKIWRN